MKLKIKENSISRDRLMEAISAKFNGKYKVSPRKKGVIVIAKNNIIGTVILVRKKSLIINGNFSTMPAQIIYTILLVLLGILLPILVYFIFFHRKMKVVEKEVGEFIKENYTDAIIP